MTKPTRQSPCARLLSDIAQRHFDGAEDSARTGSRDRDLAPRGRYWARDGWLVLSAVRDDQWRATAAVLGIAETDRFADGHRRKVHEKELDVLIGERLADGDVAAWVNALTAVGVPAAPVNSLADALDSPLVRDRGLAYDSVHPTVGPVRNLASPLLVDSARAGTGGASPVLGADTDAVLAELGYDDVDLDRLAESGVIRRGGTS